MVIEFLCNFCEDPPVDWVNDSRNAHLFTTDTVVAVRVRAVMLLSFCSHLDVDPQLKLEVF